MATANESVIQQICESAYRTLHARKVETTNLYVDSEIREKGALVGPDFQNIKTDRPSIVVFVDEQPLANFAHSCRYRLHDAEKGELYRDVPARFPPYVKTVPETLRAFHQPITVRPNPNIFKVKPNYHCPIILPDGTRYAILFAGMSNKRHANDLEFLYRTLVDRYGFDKKNIYVLNYDGTLNSQDGALTTWPGDGTAFRMKVTGQGNKAAFEAAFDDLKGKLKAKDLLLIHTNNHGGNNGPGQSFLCTYPNWGAYFATDFGNKLAQLPKYRALIVMMEQCHAGGFNSFVIAKSTAAATSIASAVIEADNSWGTADGNWDCFAHDWIAAQAGHQPTGGALASNPDTNQNGKIEANEAFNYALSIHYSGDSPTYSENAPAGGAVTLGQQYIISWLWCPILIQLLEPYYRSLPPEEFYNTLNQRLAPQFQELVAAAARDTDVATKTVQPKLAALVASSFGAK